MAVCKAEEGAGSGYMRVAGSRCSCGGLWDPGEAISSGLGPPSTSSVVWTVFCGGVAIDPVNKSASSSASRLISLSHSPHYERRGRTELEEVYARLVTPDVEVIIEETSAFEAQLR